MYEPGIEELVTYLSTKLNKIFYDREFVSNVSSDFQQLKNKNNKCCVLVFPALGPVYQRALRYQAKAFDLATFGLSGGHFRTLAVCQKEFLLSENKPEISELKNDMSSENLTSSRDSSARKKRPERPLYVPPAQRRLASSKENIDVTNSKVGSSSRSSTKLKYPLIQNQKKIHINQKEALHDQSSTCQISTDKPYNIKNDVFPKKSENGGKNCSVPVLSLRDIIDLNFLPLPKYSCNVTHRADDYNISLRLFHETCCDFYQYLVSDCENFFEVSIPIYGLNDKKFLQFLVNYFFCWQPTTTDNLIDFEEIIENNCAIHFFNYIKNADVCDFLKSELTNDFTVNQMKLCAKIKIVGGEQSGILNICSVGDPFESESIFNDTFYTGKLLRIVCDNEPYEHIVDLSDYAMGHYFKIPYKKGLEFFYVCDEEHDVKLCYMEVQQKLLEKNADNGSEAMEQKDIPQEASVPTKKREDIIKLTDSVKIDKPKVKMITPPNNQNAKISENLKSKCSLEEEKEIMRRTKENIRKIRPTVKYSDDRDDFLRIDKQDNVNNWEELFDDNGQIQEELMTEIVQKVGKDMTIVKATEDYRPYMQKTPDDLEHVVELYDFPPSLGTGDIIHAFSMFDSDSMYIIWVDDTHALLVLGSSSQAQRAMEVKNPMIKVRPMSMASSGSLTAVSRYDMKPAMKRPETNLQTARRMITNHLGTKSQVTKEQTAKEREHLRRAREQRNLTRRNERDAWEGNVRSVMRQ